MQSYSLKTCLLIAILVCSKITQSQSYYQTIAYFTSGVTRNVTATDTSATVSASDIQAVLTKYRLSSSSVYPAFAEFNEADTLLLPNVKTGQTDSIKQMDRAKIFTITVTDTVTRKNLMADLGSLSEVLFVEENGDATSAIIPHDPAFLTYQWYLSNAQYPGHDIHAEKAWDIFTGNPNGIIAIIDEGVDVNHQDLKAKIVGGDNSFNIRHSGSLYYSHGTEVAGVAAAITDNSIGISGVDWQAKILPEDRTDYWNCWCLNYFKTSHGDNLITKKLLNAINYSSNVWTLNNSWFLSDKNGNPGPNSTIVREAFSQAYKNNRVSVTATGNNGAYAPANYPSAFNTGLIAVGQTDEQDNMQATYFGSYMDVVAPGHNIYTTEYNNGYITQGGTSLAASQVSGLASLIKGYNTNLYNDDIEQIIKLSADQIPAYGPGWNDVSGYGRINAQKALQFLQPPYQLQHFTATGGTAYSTGSVIIKIFLGAMRLRDALYSSQRIEVRTTINLPTNYCSIVGVWGTGVKTTGWREDGPACFGEGFCEVVPGSQTATQVTLRTYVYQIGSRYYPRDPANVTFAYTILGIPQSTITISGTSPLCTTSGTFTANNVPAGSAVTWSVTPTSGVASLPNTPVGNPITLTMTGNGQVTLKASAPSACSSYTLTASTIVNVGVPDATKISVLGNNTYCAGYGQPQTYVGEYNYSYRNSASYGITQYNWQASPYWNQINYNQTNGSPIDPSEGVDKEMVTIKWTYPGNVYTSNLQTRAMNGCGWSNWSTVLPVQVSNCGGNNFAASPNPVESEVVITDTSSSYSNQLNAKLAITNNKAADNKLTGTNNNSINIMIYDLSHKFLKQFTFSHNKNYHLNVSDLSAGVYILQIKDGLNISSLKIIKK